MYNGLHGKYWLFSPFLIKLKFSLRLFEKHTNIRFHENPFSGRHVETDVTKLIVAFRNIAKAPKNRLSKGCIFFEAPLK
jgi:hypothetical protein